MDYIPIELTPAFEATLWLLGFDALVDNALGFCYVLDINAGFVKMAYPAYDLCII